MLKSKPPPRKENVIFVRPCSYPIQTDFGVFTCLIETPSPQAPVVRSPDPATGGDGGGAGGKVSGLRPRAAAGLGRRGGHPLLGRPLPRRHGSVHRRGEQAPDFQRKDPSSPFDYAAAFSFATLIKC